MEVLRLGWMAQGTRLGSDITACNIPKCGTPGRIVGCSIFGGLACCKCKRQSSDERYQQASDE